MLNKGVLEKGISRSKLVIFFLNPNQHTLKLFFPMLVQGLNLLSQLLLQSSNLVFQLPVFLSQRSQFGFQIFFLFFLENSLTLKSLQLQSPGIFRPFIHSLQQFFFRLFPFLFQKNSLQSRVSLLESFYFCYFPIEPSFCVFFKFHQLYILPSQIRDQLCLLAVLFKGHFTHLQFQSETTHFHFILLSHNLQLSKSIFICEADPFICQLQFMLELGCLTLGRQVVTLMDAETIIFFFFTLLTLFIHHFAIVCLSLLKLIIIPRPLFRLSQGLLALFHFVVSFIAFLQFAQIFFSDEGFEGVKHDLNNQRQRRIGFVSIIQIGMADQKKTQIVVLTFQKNLNISELFEEALQDKFDKEFFKNSKQYFSEHYYVFEAKQKNHRWILLKTQQDIEKLFDALFKTYSISRDQFDGQLSSAKKIGGPNEENSKGETFVGVLNNFCQEILCNRDQRLQFFLEKPQNQAYCTFQMMKKSGGRYNENFCCRIGSIFNDWNKRSISIYSKGVAYRNIENKIKEFMLFGQGFEFGVSIKKNSKQLGVVLHSNHRKLALKAQNPRDFIIFSFVLRQLLRNSPYMEINRFNSFAPINYNNEATFYIDGDGYFEALAYSIMRAKKTVYITGWMISPEFLLIRQQNQKISLENALKIASSNGAKISIMLYHESSFLPNDSLYTKEKLEQLDKNITVLRHPNNLLPVLWSHHGKMVIIDEKEAYSGGLDICYGRYDTLKHELFDNENIYPGIEYNNIRMNDGFNVKEVNKMSIPAEKCRMPWHDIAQHFIGQVVADFSYHFTQLWNFVSYHSKQHFTLDPNKMDQTSRQQIDNGLRSSMNRTNSRMRTTKSPMVLSRRTSDRQQQFFKHNKYQKPKFFQKMPLGNFQHKFQKYLKTVKDEIKSKNLVDRELGRLSGTNKMTRSQRISNLKRFSADIARDLLKSRLKLSTRDRKKPIFILTGSKMDDFIDIEINEDYVNCLEKIKQKYEPEPNLVMEEDIESDNDPTDAKIPKSETLSGFAGRDECQMVRSVGNWSFGFNPNNTECSIYIAYLQLISQAKYFIYIENQFFISSTAGKTVKNEIADAIYKRILKAIDQKEVFRVYIILPLLPGFAGDLINEECILLRKEMEWNYDTISNGPQSLIGMLKRITNTPQQYIQFLSLRNHGRKNSVSQPQTELIYVHSKLLIIDDEIVLCGSANLNDRSLLGNRDSQIAVVTKGLKLFEGKMNGEVVTVSETVLNLRLRLFEEHFGVSHQYALDPIRDEIWGTITDRAKSNTQIYRTIFGCYPDDTAETISQMQELNQFRQLQKYNRLKEEIVGHVVEFPLNFLSKQKVSLDIRNKEFYLPDEVLI